MNKFFNISDISDNIELSNSKKLSAKKVDIESLQKDTSNKITKTIDNVWKTFNWLNPVNNVISYEWDSKSFLQFDNNESHYYIFHESIIKNNENNNNFNLVSWTCLFDTKSIIWIDENWNSLSLINPYIDINKKIVELYINQSITLYEAESITRLFSLIKNIKTEKIINFDFHIPYGEYILYLADIYNSWMIEKELYNTYINELEIKSKNISNIITKKIPPSIKSKFFINNNLDWLVKYIKYNIQNNNLLDIDEIKNILIEDEIFKNLFNYSNITSFKELIHISYIYLYIKNSINNNMVVVENQNEINILRNTKKILKKLSIQNNIVWFYSQPGIIPYDWNYSYFTSIESTLWNLKKICHLYANK